MPKLLAQRGTPSPIVKVLGSMPHSPARMKEHCSYSPCIEYGHRLHSWGRLQVLHNFWSAQLLSEFVKMKRACSSWSSLVVVSLMTHHSNFYHPLFHWARHLCKGHLFNLLALDLIAPLQLKLRVKQCGDAVGRLNHNASNSLLKRKI